MWEFFGVCMVGICVSIVLLIRKFAAKNVTLIIRLATAYAWLTTMMVIALVPMDCWASYSPPPSTEGIFILWNIAYWSTQAATWLVMPFYQVYADAGDFSIKNRCWTSLKENALLYGSIGAVAIIGVIIILATVGMDRWTDLLSIGVFASNAFGLFAGLILMGYGLVEIPRAVWLTSNPETALKWSAHRCGKFAEAVMRSTNELRTVVVIIFANAKQMRATDPLKPFMDIISEEAEKDSPIKPSVVAQENIDFETLRAEDLEYNFEKKGLSNLRRRMFWAIADYQGARAQYERAMLEAFELEDVIKCRANKDYTPRAPEGKSPGMWSRQVWVYKCVARPFANKVFAVLLAITSLLLIWGEVTIPVFSEDLSPFSLMLHSPYLNSFVFQLLTALPLIYMCACSYYALFKINIDNKYFQFNYNKLVAGATTGAALMQNGSLMCRFAAPTCWNFYHIIRYAKDYCSDEDQAENKCVPTVFSVIMASMADINKVFNINTYLPVILVVHCAMVALGIWERLFNMCVSEKFRFSTDDIDDEYTEKGRLLVRKEQEATSKGYAIGEVLHSAYFDLEFPTIANYGQYGRKKESIFSIFKKKKKTDKASELPPAAMPKFHSVVNRPADSAAAMAAAKWLRTGSDPTMSGTGGMDVTDDRASLLGGKVADSSHAAPLASSHAAGHSGPAGGGGGGGGGTNLDSLFSGLSTKNFASGFGGKPAGSGMGGGAGAGLPGASAASWFGGMGASGAAGGAAGAGSAGTGAGAASGSSFLGLPSGAGAGGAGGSAAVGGGGGGGPSYITGTSAGTGGAAATYGGGSSGVSSSSASFTSTKLVFGPAAPSAPSSSGASFTTAKLMFGKK